MATQRELSEYSNRMNERVARALWFGGSFVGAMITRGLGHRSPLGSAIAICATAVWFLGWLMRDNLRFKKEVAIQRQQLAERRAAVRAARDAARPQGRDRPRT